ncbi:hypothetical protein R3P38DRAFT_3355980 [Favolaschia claudopus]|uniref:Uncharacterized protein n=1 Tax=Favolaschia claudopus TaxID=2862362 RepID=A0AAW0BGL5_9AGAR
MGLPKLRDSIGALRFHESQGGGGWDGDALVGAVLNRAFEGLSPFRKGLRGWVGLSAIGSLGGGGDVVAGCEFWLAGGIEKYEYETKTKLSRFERGRAAAGRARIAKSANAKRDEAMVRWRDVAKSEDCGGDQSGLCKQGENGGRAERARANSERSELFRYYPLPFTGARIKARYQVQRGIPFGTRRRLGFPTTHILGIPDGRRACITRSNFTAEPTSINI